mmetsp:Transcript_16588/g.56043  ORF Transcript_16588/g.56043 Transcript_16588/m.56043 type:complete len:211 (+) Transcript_16588:173-805(+)
MGRRRRPQARLVPFHPRGRLRRRRRGRVAALALCELWISSQRQRRHQRESARGRLCRQRAPRGGHRRHHAAVVPQRLQGRQELRRGGREEIRRRRGRRVRHRPQAQRHLRHAVPLRPQDPALARPRPGLRGPAQRAGHDGEDDGGAAVPPRRAPRTTGARERRGAHGHRRADGRNLRGQVLRPRPRRHPRPQRLSRTGEPGGISRLKGAS